MSDEQRSTPPEAGPYRTPAERTSDLRITVAPRRSIWRWLACFVRGHRWVVTRENLRRASALMHLHHMAGCDATCRRCGTVWLDADPLLNDHRQVFGAGRESDVVDVDPYEVRS